jgi:hypothetical protein
VNTAESNVEVRGMHAVDTAKSNKGHVYRLSMVYYKLCMVWPQAATSVFKP